MRKYTRCLVDLLLNVFLQFLLMSMMSGAVCFLGFLSWVTNYNKKKELK